MKISNVLSGMAAVALVVAPVAANAGTSAASSIATAPAYGARASMPVAKKQNMSAGITVLAVVAVAAAGFGIYEAVKDDNKSRGV